MPSITSTSSNLKVLRDLLIEVQADHDDREDVEERIQQQLAQINNQNNLEPGERFS